MQDKPFGASLLEVAGQALTQDVAPHLEGKRRYIVLMAANAMGIVAREIEAQAELAEAWGRALAGDEEADALVAAGRLVNTIRAGGRDADPGLHEALLETATIAAAIWKPAKPSA